MEHLINDLDSIKILIIGDLRVVSASRFVDRFITYPPQFHMVLTTGPYLGKKKIQPFVSPQQHVHLDEKISSELSDVASVIVLLENLVCRTVYLASSKTDPSILLTDQLLLTPNSVNIHARRLNIENQLFLIGFSEKYEEYNKVDIWNSDIESHKEIISDLTSNLVLDILNESFEDSKNFHQHGIIESENIIHPSQTISIDSIKPSLPIIHSTITSTSYNANNNLKKMNDFGIFVMEIRLMKTLYKILFDLHDKFECAGIKILVLNLIEIEDNEKEIEEEAKYYKNKYKKFYNNSSILNNNNIYSNKLPLLPSRIGNINIIVIPSFHKDTLYSVLDLKKNNKHEWEFDDLNYYEL